MDKNDPKFSPLFNPENKSRIERWENKGLDRIKSDLENNEGLGLVGGTGQVKDLAWLWVEYKEGLAKEAEELPRYRKFLYNPWTLLIAGAVIGAIINELFNRFL